MYLSLQNFETFAWKREGSVQNGIQVIYEYGSQNRISKVSFVMEYCRSLLLWSARCNALQSLQCITWVVPVLVWLSGSTVDDQWLPSLHDGIRRLHLYNNILYITPRESNVYTVEAKSDFCESIHTFSRSSGGSVIKWLKCRTRAFDSRRVPAMTLPDYF